MRSSTFNEWGPIEGINHKIKLIKRVYYGYRNFWNFRNLILIISKVFVSKYKQPVWDINTKINSSKMILTKIVFELPFYYHASYYIGSLSEGTASACSLRLVLFPQEPRYKYFAYICNHSPLYLNNKALSYNLINANKN